MRAVFEHVWTEVQDRVEAGVRLSFACKNITPTREQVLDELDKRMIALVEKLFELASS